MKQIKVYEITTYANPLLAVIALTVGFAANDTAVIVQSARYPPGPGMTGFTEIGGSPNLANHASILCSEIGTVPLYCHPSPPNPVPAGAAATVLSSIQNAEQNLNEPIQ